ncbi:MAG: tetratricopeptide repeat protein, partial [Elusimicrobiota bacterium]|nr:tetratricopeptide repeat protein [Elusimicrobiota bacterium]
TFCILFFLLSTFCSLLSLSSVAIAAPKTDELAKRQEMLRIAANLKESIKQTPKKVDLYVQLGFIYSKLKNINEAQKAFERAVKLDPKKAKAHFMLGLIYEKKKLNKRAIAAWQACLDNTTDKKTRATAFKHLRFLRAK